MLAVTIMTLLFYYHYFPGDPLSQGVFYLGPGVSGTPYLLREASRNPLHKAVPEEWDLLLSSQREERQAQFQSQEALGRGRRMDFFLLLLF